jgi:ATP-binding cassette subfamily B protein
MAYEPAKRLSRLQVDLSASLRGVQMFYDFLSEHDIEEETQNAPLLQIKLGNIKFKDVDFSYRPLEQVLNKLNFSAEHGQITALVGPSGGGKSTIMSLLLRYWKPQSGLISIDDKDITAVQIKSLRKNIAYVSQDVFLFNGTIKENIAMGKPDASDEEIIAAAQMAFAHDFITGFDQGYNTHCGENGIQLSGGQKQRISIARAILKNAPILLLDEATSALDNESEKKIQLALSNLTKGRTTIVIAHRLTTIQSADKICFVKNGSVTEEGTHQQLISRVGDYQKLISSIEIQQLSS